MNPLRRARRVLARMRDDEVRAPLQPLKTCILDFAVERCGARSLADLGGVWGVRAGYARYAAAHHDLDRVVLVDTGVDDDLRRRTADLPNLECLTADFGDPDVAARVGDVDVVLFYDVLLHQVAPDWDTVFATWAARARCIAVVQPTWVRTDQTTRLLDLDESEYRSLVPDEPLARQLYRRLDEIHPAYGRPWRDVHEVWQWGITHADLDAAADAAGLRRVALVDDGPWQGLEAFDSVAVVYLREED